MGDAGVVPGFEDLAEIARSERAVVARAWQPAFQRHVAVKLLPGGKLETLADESLRARALAGHPNVVTVHEFGVTSERVPFVAMELLEKGSLGERNRRDGAMDWYEATRLTITLAGVLAVADDVDVSPERVLLSRFGEPKVVVIGAGPSSRSYSLRSTLRAMLTGDLEAEDRAKEPDLSGAPAALVQTVMDPGPEPTPAELVSTLQAVQAEAGRPVTELPRSRVAFSEMAPPDGTPSILSGAATVAPPVPPGGRTVRDRVIIGGLAVLAVVTVALVAAPANKSAPPQPRSVGATPASAITTTPAAPAVTTASTGIPPRPVDPPLYVTDFSPGTVAVPPSSALGWLEVTHTDAGLRLQILERARTFVMHPWSASVAESKLSVAVRVENAASPLSNVGVICGEDGAGLKGLTAVVSKNGQWQIFANGSVITRGAAPSLVGQLQSTFVLRMDCITDRTPTKAWLYVNDALVGEATGPDAFPMRMAGVRVGSLDPPGEFTLKAMEVRRLD